MIPQRWRGKKRAADDYAASTSVGDSGARRDADRLIELAHRAEDDGDTAAALARIMEAIACDPGYAKAHLNLGNVLRAEGDVDGAITATVEAVRLDEVYAEARYNLGLLYDVLGSRSDAEAQFRKALELRPRFPEAAVALAGLLEATDRAQEAKAWLRGALADDPRYAGAALNLARLLQIDGQAAEAEQELRRAVDIDPAYLHAYCALGELCKSQRRASEAREWYLKAVEAGRTGLAAERDPLLARAAWEVAIAYIDEGRWQEAEVLLEDAIRLAREWGGPYISLAHLQSQRGRIDLAIELLQKVIAMAPNLVSPRGYVLYFLNMVDGIAPAEIFDEHRRFGKWLEELVERRNIVYANSIDPGRSLRVGYVSADYRVHPVAQFLSPLLDEHDPSRVEAYCYSNTLKPDEFTAALQRRFANSWRDITNMTDDQVADLVIEDGIDVLVDLSGHTADTRLTLFALKPAPVQVTWLGYLNTTGLMSIDYRLVDRFTDPVGETDTLNTERLVRLPDSQWAYWPMFEVPVLRAEDAGNSRPVLFGSFNQYMKLTDRCLDLWAKVLNRVPDSRLRIAGLPHGVAEEPLLLRLEKAGVARCRVDVVRRMPHLKYLQLYNDVDIALDSMPYNGATTTLDTLWMGVPIVALLGDRPISRGTYSILKTLGRDDLIAATDDEYVELNAKLATDANWRRRLHLSLREELRRSPLCDIAKFTENLEAAYREMWREWCDRQTRI